MNWLHFLWRKYKMSEEFLNAMERPTNTSRTENEALTYQSTLNANLDWFAMSGGLRFQSEDRIISLFMKAFYEDKLLAMKNLFYTRDIRQGLGERRVFRVVLKYLAQTQSDVVKKNLSFIPFFGRWDDLYVLIDTPVENDMWLFVKQQLFEDLKSDHPSLLAKWLKSENTSSQESIKLAKKTRRALGMTPKEYRKTLAVLRERIDVLERRLSMKDYTFDYEKIPSQAMLKYKKAFLQNDRDRYTEYIEKVIQGKKKIKTDTLSVVQLVRKILLDKGEMSLDEKKYLDVLWNNISKIDTSENALVVADTSGSMFYACGQYALGIAASVGLALYYAENNKGVFHNRFITFSARPKLQKIKGQNIYEKVKFLEHAGWDCNTDIEAVFTLILNTAIKNNLSQEDLPKKLYIVSDMEFDEATRVSPDSPLFDAIREEFKKHGYELPTLVFWNVSSRQNNVPATKETLNVFFVSGMSQKIFENLIKNRLPDPVVLMIEVLNNERYSIIQI
jgi:hypothetical protein